MKKKDILIVLLALMFWPQRDGDTQTKADTNPVKTYRATKRAKLPPGPSVKSVTESTEPGIDSLVALSKEQEKDKNRSANLYLQMLTDKKIMLGLAYQQKMMNKIDALQKKNDSLLLLLNTKPKVITLQPVYEIQPTQYRGLVPIPQKSNRDKRKQADIRNMYRDSIYTTVDTVYVGTRVS